MGAVRKAVVLLVLALLAVGCGLSADESPRTINSQDLPAELRLGQLPTPTPRPASESGPGTQQIHMVQNGRLVTVQRQIVDTPEQLMEILLLDTFPEERAEGIRSALDFQTRVQDIEFAELSRVVVVDLAPGSLNPSNSEQRVAFAQIVYTLTSLDGIDGVRFVQTDPNDPDAGAVDLAVQTDDGTTLPGSRVTRDDFALLAPTSGVPQPSFDIPVTTPTPTPDPNAPPVFDLLVFMLDSNDELIEVPRRIERSPEALLIAVIDGTFGEERDAGIRSAWPLDALADSIEIANFEVEALDEFGFTTLARANIATVNLTSGSLPAVEDGDERYLAAAQIVYSLTSLEEIDQVVFAVDDVAIPMVKDDGALSLPFDPNIPFGLSRSDYVNALPLAEREALEAEAAAPEPAASDGDPAPGLTPEPTATPGA